LLTPSSWTFKYYLNGLLYVSYFSKQVRNSYPLLLFWTKFWNILAFLDVTISLEILRAVIIPQSSVSQPFLTGGTLIQRNFLKRPWKITLFQPKCLLFSQKNSKSKEKQIGGTLGRSSQHTSVPWRTGWETLPQREWCHWLHE
jgi:hypothetical protein